MSTDQFQFSINTDNATTVKTMVLVTYNDMSGILAFVLGGAPTAEELVKMLSEGAFGPDAAAIVGSASGFASQFEELMEGGFSDAMMADIGFDVPMLAEMLETFGANAPSSEEAYAKAIASRDGWAMEDYTTESVVLFVSGQAITAGLIVTEYAPGQAKLVGLALIGVGLVGAALSGDSASEKRKKEKEGDQTSTDPQDDPDDPEEVAKADDSDGSSDDDKQEVASKDDDKPKTDEATTTPKDPTVDGSGAANGTPPPEDGQDGGDRDPEEDQFLFVVVNLDKIEDDKVQALILTDPDKFFADLPDYDPNMIDELTQPGPDDVDGSGSILG